MTKESKDRRTERQAFIRTVSAAFVKDGATRKKANFLARTKWDRRDK